MNAISTLEAVKARTADEEPLFEIIDGQRVELPPMSYYAVLVATRLVAEIQQFAKAHDLGRAVSEGLFHLALPIDRNRRPDLAFVSYARWPKDRPLNKGENAWDVTPDLAVEVVSPTDYAEELMTKIDEYFRAGVRLVWVIFPAHGLVHVYESWTTVRILTRADTLDGGAVVPGFQLPLRELFVEE
jgi:Uma2 family endonuclease